MADAYYRHPTNPPRPSNAIPKAKSSKPLPPAPSYYTDGSDGSSGQYPRAFLSRNTRGYFPPVYGPQAPEPAPQLPPADPNVLDEDVKSKRWSDEYDVDSDRLRPQCLKKPTPYSVLFTIGDIFMALLPLLFIVLAILAAKLHDNKVEDNATGKNVVKALKLGPTLFPIIFAAVAGRGMKTIARYYAERGAKLGMLELLVASQTVWGAFETQVRLKHLSLIGIHLLLLWSMSPLGSQASFRLLGLGTSEISNSSNIFYLPTGGMSTHQFAASTLLSADIEISLEAMNAQYNAALLSNSDLTEDLWTNVKIPWYPEDKQGEPGQEDWVRLPHANSSDSFAALVGLPIAREHTLGTVTFDVPVAYFQFQCNSKWNVSYNDNWWRQQLGQLWGDGGVYEGRDPLGWTSTREDADPTSSRKFTQFTSFFLDTNTKFGNRFDDFYKNTSTESTANLLPPRNILFGSRNVRQSEQTTYKKHKRSPQPSTADTDIILRNCTVEMPYFDTKVKCVAGNCKVIAMRPSAKYHSRDPAITPFDYITVAANMFTKLPLSSGTAHFGATSPFELFILGSKTPLLTWKWNGPSDIVDSVSYRENGIERFQNMFEVPDTVFARRFGTLLNTYYMLSISPYSFGGHLPPPPQNSSQWSINGHEYSYWQPCKNCILGPFFSESATAQITNHFEVYKCNYVWLALLLIASVVLLILGSFGTVLKGYCFAPDTLGFVSSSTYDNKYMDLPTSGVLDGMERARLLKHVTIKIGDVWSAKKVGHVALSSGNNLASPLKLGKLYV